MIVLLQYICKEYIVFAIISVDQNMINLFIHMYTL